MGLLVNSHRLVTCSLTALSSLPGHLRLLPRQLLRHLPRLRSPPGSSRHFVGTQEGVGRPVRPRKRIDGTFGAPTDVRERGSRRVLGVDVADSDGDGDLDFLAADGLSGAVYLYENLD